MHNVGCSFALGSAQCSHELCALCRYVSAGILPAKWLCWLMERQTTTTSFDRVGVYQMRHRFESCLVSSHAFGSGLHAMPRKPWPFGTGLSIQELSSTFLRLTLIMKDVGLDLLRLTKWYNLAWQLLKYCHGRWLLSSRFNNTIHKFRPVHSTPAQNQ